jgi:hypothetical protein
MGLGGLVLFFLSVSPFISLSDLLIFAAYSAAVGRAICFRFFGLLVPHPFVVLVSLGLFFELLRLIGLVGFPFVVFFCGGFSGFSVFEALGSGEGGFGVSWGLCC